MANNTFYVIPKDSDLTHHGVKGMKWGIRKGYLTKSGKLTPKGRAYYNKMNKRYGESSTINVVGRTIGGLAGISLAGNLAIASGNAKLANSVIEEVGESVQKSTKIAIGALSAASIAIGAAAVYALHRNDQQVRYEQLDNIINKNKSNTV